MTASQKLVYKNFNLEQAAIVNAQTLVERASDCFIGNGSNRFDQCGAISIGNTG